jgi:hypothetical protein
MAPLQISVGRLLTLLDASLGASPELQTAVWTENLENQSFWI